MGIFGLLLLLQAQGAKACDRAPDLSLTLVLESRVVHLGEPIPYHLRYENVSEETYYIHLTSQFGPEHLSLIAEFGGCRVSTPVFWGDSPIAVARFSWVPLAPGARYEEPPDSLAPAAGTSLGGSLPLKVPGRYRVKAVLNSDGPTGEGLIWPIWRGTVESNPVELEVLPAESATVEQNLKVIGACAGDRPGSRCESEGGLFDAVVYFSAVRDARVVGPLCALLKRGVHSTFVVDALLNQGGGFDAIKEFLVAEDFLKGRERSADYRAKVEARLAAGASRGPCD